jgi:purine nucleosidase
MRKTILLLLAMLYIVYDTSGQVSIIIDADTANEVDDIVAIARAIMADDIDVAGLTAAQWSHQGTYGRHTARESWDLNNEILRILGRNDIPSRQGSELKLAEQWSGYALFSGGKLQPRKSNAADFIIEKALGQHGEDKLIILVLGPLTNIASAILQEPAIIDRISVRYIGTIYDLSKDAWNKNEFNSRNDPNALDVVLNTAGLDLHIMPANVASPLTFSNKSSMARLTGQGGISELILEKWKEMVPGPTDDWGWIMWDLALIHSIINPQWVEKKRTSTPPENTQRPIWVYTSIDHEKMRKDFWINFTSGN